MKNKRTLRLNFFTAENAEVDVKKARIVISMLAFSLDNSLVRIMFPNIS